MSIKYTRPETFTDRLYYLLDTGIQQIADVMKVNPKGFVDIETVDDDPQALVMTDGTMLTAIRLDGMLNTVLAEEFVTLLDTLETKIQSYIEDGTHHLSFFFEFDPTEEGIRREIRNTYSRAVSLSAEKKGLDISDLIEEQESVLATHCHLETVYLLLWTTRGGMSKEENRIASKERSRKRKGLPLAIEAQDLGCTFDGLRKKHMSYYGSFYNDVREMGYLATILDSHELLHNIRSTIDREQTSSDWMPSIPGDKLPLRLTGQLRPDASGVLWPPIKDQMVPRGFERLGNGLCQCGNVTMSPISMELQPKNPEPFHVLFRRLKKENIPWRMHLMIKNNGMSILSFKELLASMLVWTPGQHENKRLVDVKKKLSALQDTNETIVKQQVTLCTWGPSNDIDLVEKRRAQLIRATQSWGISDVAQAEGDEVETFFSTTPGATLSSVANVSAAPLYESIKMAPISRPASAWTTGSQPLRTADGKLMLHHPYSRMQTSWISLIFAPMGFGKSVFMNYSNLSLVMSPDIDELPFISILDVGPSSRGLIQLVKNALPKHKQSLAMYARLRNTRDYSINFGDTPLGLRKPPANQRDFLINMLCYLCESDTDSTIADGLSGLAAAVVDEAYAMLADPITSNRYRKGVNQPIDHILEKHSFVDDPKLTDWWEVVDFLFHQGEIETAIRAQRYAVPQLSTFATVAQNEKVSAIYRGVIHPGTKENLTSYMWRKLTECINKYPVISDITKFDVGNARVISLDLDEVAKGEGHEAKRLAGLMYLLSFQVMNSKFYFVKDHLVDVPDEVGKHKVDYRSYHLKFINTIAKIPKRICIDEKHRVNGLTLVEKQFDMAIREGRKWLIEIIQASQMPDDFSEEAVGMATSIYILGGGNASNREKIRKKFGLGETMSYHLKNSMRRPSKDGSTLLALWDTSYGASHHHLMSSQGPRFLWATNSSRNDAFVRDTLGGLIGDKEARSLLVEFYPSGNLDDEIERRKLVETTKASTMKYEGQDLNGDEKDEETSEGLLMDIVHELQAVFNRRRES